MTATVLLWYEHECIDGHYHRFVECTTITDEGAIGKQASNCPRCLAADCWPNIIRSTRIHQIASGSVESL